MGLWRFATNAPQRVQPCTETQHPFINTKGTIKSQTQVVPGSHPLIVGIIDVQCIMHQVAPSIHRQGRSYSLYTSSFTSSCFSYPSTCICFASSYGAIFPSVGLLLWEGRQYRDNSSHPIKAVLDSQFLKVLPCDSLINQAPYLNLAASKSNKLRLSDKNTPSRHPHVLTRAHTRVHILPFNLSQFENTATCVIEIFDGVHTAIRMDTSNIYSTNALTRIHYYCRGGHNDRFLMQCVQ